MTFSIVARDSQTGELGVATATAGPAVGALVPHVRAGRAAMATQAMTNPYLAVDTLAAIPAADAEHALQGALARDPESDRRQAIVIDAQGRIGAWTGIRCEDYAGHAMDENVAVAGNIIAGRAVLDAMLGAFRGPGDLAERLFAALQAGNLAGGDRRTITSAALKVVRNQAYPEVDLRVDWSTDPIADLSDLIGRTRQGSYAEFFSAVLRRGAGS